MNLDIWKKVKIQDFSPIYLLCGKEAFLINETKDLIIKHALNEEERDFNLSVLDLEETPIDVALADAETLPFMGERRVVIIKNPLFLTAEKGKEKVEHNLSAFEAYINSPAPFTVLIIEAPYEKFDERKKIVKLLKAKASIFSANPLNENELKQWISEKVKEYNVEITQSAIIKLINLVGTNLLMITNEIEKLCLYVGMNNTITDESVDLLVARTLEQNIFELIEKVVNRKLAEALRIFYDLLRNNEEPIKILSLLATQFRLIYQVKVLSKKGYGQKQMASNLKIHPFRVKLASGQANLFSEGELLTILNNLAEADYQMKNGKMDKKLILELFIMNLAK